VKFLEETGYSFKSWRRLIKVVQPPTTKINWFVYMYLAWDVSGKDSLELDAGGEKVQHQASFFDEAKAALGTG